MTVRIKPILAVLAASSSLVAQSPAPTPVTAATPDTSELFDLGKQLFDQYATPEVKAQFEFPTREQWDAFAVRLQEALQNGSIEDLAGFAPEARAASTAIKVFPGYEDYADWLDERLDYLEAAEELAPPAPPRPDRPGPSVTPTPRLTRPTSPTGSRVPYYDLWLRRMKNRPIPASAAALLPRMRAAFAAEGLPPELVWLAEAESSFNPAARSPAGAKGLFQFMPDTAKSLGLSTFLPDDRTSPEKSARAAARYLKTLHGRFGDWPLAIAAYNAGEGRVSRALQARSAKDFAGVASSLPSETRMYVPKVCALIATRAGVTPEKIPAPR
jgi:membrane-bound lytic murein transglycosylase D